jgi:GDP-L-fucose synthase
MADRFLLAGRTVWVAGHTGLVGSALVRSLEKKDADLITVPRARLDLRRQSDVETWMEDRKPDVVVLAAAKVGGIGANSEYPADFIYDNLVIAQNVIHQAFRQKVKKLVFLGSSCIYPKHAPQPISESSLLSGLLEPTNEAYAIAKIAGLKLCQFYRRQHGCDFISVMPCNLYGPGDRWNDAGSHVIPALMARFHDAKQNNLPEVTVWGSGTPLREFLYSDDLADAVLFALRNYSDERPLNIGSGEEISIRALASLIANTVGYKGQIVFDPDKPDGTPRKIMDSSRLRQLGWKPQVGMEEGLKNAYADFLGNKSSKMSTIS